MREEERERKRRGERERGREGEIERLREYEGIFSTVTAVWEHPVLECVTGCPGDVCQCHSSSSSH